MISFYYDNLFYSSNKKSFIMREKKKAIDCYVEQ